MSERNLIRLKDGEYPVTEAPFAARFPRIPRPFGREAFAARGYAIVYPWKPPDCGPDQYVVELGPAKNANGTWRQRWEVRDYTAEELIIRMAEVRAAKLAEINALRDGKIAAGIPFLFPDSPGTVQTRDLIDARNIQTNISAAIILQAAGETGPVMMFRDMEDAIHPMTPQQMIEMGMYAGQQGQAIYTASWVHKDAVAGLHTIAEIKAYDTTGGWPV
ncbi:MAG: DUF4376 domain-containing protein [Dehalococcoidales bacterium]|nr:DUF4376 domain-containing protein [Dehalococcoidales bacterium]